MTIDTIKMFCRTCKVTKPGKFCSDCGAVLVTLTDQLTKTWKAEGVWHVTTESDEEGRRPDTDLGVYEGHIVDIAKALSKKAYHQLKFAPASSLEEVAKLTPAKSVKVQLHIDSGTWDLTPEQRAIYFSKMVSDRDDVEVAETTYFGAVELHFKKPKPTTCQYIEPWVGPCGKGKEKFCADHKGVKCRCGKQATRGCDNAGSLVCGQPLCGSCYCHH